MTNAKSESIQQLIFASMVAVVGGAAWWNSGSEAALYLFGFWCAIHVVMAFFWSTG